MIIHSKVKNYTLEIIEDFFDKRAEILAKMEHDKLFYFVDENVYTIYGDRIEKFIGGASLAVIPAIERNKSYIKLADYYRMLINSGFTRNDILITLGGGILQDISGFIASTMYRGIRWIYIPTTLLAQADSCIGSKTSINFDDSKNLIGTFYPPDAIYIDHAFCNTLSDRYFKSGVGEIIKFHLMSGMKRYKLLKKFLASQDLRKSKYLKEIITSTLEIKKSYFEGDEFDSGRRNLLNYGHCFGHALESASNFAVSHGEAVIMGMGFANLISLKRRLITRQKYDEFESIFEQHYPGILLSQIPVDSIISFMKKDKKRTGKDLTMILAEDIGRQVKVDDVKEPEVRNAYKNFIITLEQKI